MCSSSSDPLRDELGEEAVLRASAREAGEMAQRRLLLGVKALFGAVLLVPLSGLIWSPGWGWLLVLASLMAFIPFAVCGLETRAKARRRIARSWGRTYRIWQQLGVV